MRYVRPTDLVLRDKSLEHGRLGHTHGPASKIVWTRRDQALAVLYGHFKIVVREYVRDRYFIFYDAEVQSLLAGLTNAQMESEIAKLGFQLHNEFFIKAAGFIHQQKTRGYSGAFAQDCGRDGRMEWLRTQIREIKNRNVHRTFHGERTRRRPMIDLIRTKRDDRVDKP